MYDNSYREESKYHNKNQWPKPSKETKRKAKERPKDEQPTGTKKGRELVPLAVGRHI
jgi:hypothetical protein